MRIEQIEGIGPSYGEKLLAAEVTDTDTLLEIGCTESGRQGLTQKTGIGESQILKWANMVDLCRIKGVGEAYSELLEFAGVDTVKELRNRNPENLAAKVAEVNEQKNLPAEPLTRKRSRTGLPKQRRCPLRSSTRF